MNNRKRMMAITMSAMLAVTSGAFSAESAVHATGINSEDSNESGKKQEDSAQVVDGVQTGESNDKSDLEQSESEEETDEDKESDQEKDETDEEESEEEQEDTDQEEESDQENNSSETTEADEETLKAIVAALNGEKIDTDLEFTIEIPNSTVDENYVQGNYITNPEEINSDPDSCITNQDEINADQDSYTTSQVEVETDSEQNTSENTSTDSQKLVFTQREDGSFSSGDVELNPLLDELMDQGVTSLEASANLADENTLVENAKVEQGENSDDKDLADAILAEGRDRKQEQSSEVVAEREIETERLLADISSLEPVDGFSEEEPDESDYEDELQKAREESEEVASAVASGEIAVVSGSDRPDNLSDLLGDTDLPTGDEYTTVDVAIETSDPDYGMQSVQQPVTDTNVVDIISSDSLEYKNDDKEITTAANSKTTYRKKQLTIRVQSARDFVEPDEFGVWRDENGDLVEPDFVRYVGVDEDEKLIFTADEEGNISYVDEHALYYNEQERRFYSDEEQTISFSGLEGLLDSAGLAMSGDTVLSLLSYVDGTATTIEIPGESIYPKRLVDKDTGEELTQEEIASKNISDDKIIEEDPVDKKYMIWKCSDEDREYAPGFASYICADEDGKVLFYADEDGRMFYDVSDHVIYGQDYFFTFNWEQNEDEKKNGKVVLRYSDLGLKHYPAAGETQYFTASGKAFSIEMYDDGEGAMGRYICRDLDDSDSVMLMDINGNICYAADDYEWRFVDYDIDYDLLKKLMQEGADDFTLDDLTIEEPEEPAEESSQNEILESEPEIIEEEIEEPDDDIIEEPDDDLDTFEDEDEDEEEDEEIEEPDEDVMIDGLTREDFASDEDWFRYARSRNNNHEDEDFDDDYDIDRAVIIDNGSDSSYPADDAYNNSDTSGNDGLYNSSEGLGL